MGFSNTAKAFATLFLLAVATSAHGQTKLNWQDNSNNEDAFHIYRRDSVSGNAWGVINNSVVPFYNDQTAIAGTVDNTYTYRVSAFNASGESAFSNEASKTILANTPPPPTSPPAPTVVVTVRRKHQCKVVLSAIPPNSTGGWTVQFRDKGFNVGSPDSSSPYSRTISISVGNHSFTARWSKSGQTTVTSAATTTTC